MIVKRIWVQTIRKPMYMVKKYRVTGFYLFGFIPLYIEKERIA